LDGIIAAGRRYDLPDVAKAYETIVKDERFHIGLGRAMLDRYVAGESDLAEVMRAMHGMAAIVLDSHTAVELPL
jgi:ribonucleotide reductase beta subunit family protein with ferritin-like domain